MAAIASGAVVVVQRHGERGADGERVVAGDAARRAATRARPPASPSTRSSTSSLPRSASSAAGVSSATICAFVHDRDPVAEPLGLVEVVGGEQDRHVAAVAQAGDQRRAARARMRGSRPTVGSSRNSTCGLRDERPGDLEPAALAAAVACRRAGRAARRGRASRRARRCGRWPRRVDAPQPGVEVEVAPAGERAVDDRVLEDDAADADRAASGSRATSKPASRAVPLVGAMVVVSMPMVVDLPAPFGPSRPNTSPAATSKSMPFTASTPPG